MIKGYHILYLLVFLVVFQACKKSISSEKQNYIGQWITGDALEQISIFQDGSATWMKQEGAVQSSINNGRIKFDENSFTIKSGLIREKFEINTEPTPVSQNSGLMYSGYKYFAKFNNQNFYRIY